MILSSSPTSIKLEAVLAGAVSTSQPEYHVDYSDWNNDNAETPLLPPSRGALNSTTDVTILAAPVNNPRREIKRISIYNKDTASITVTIKTDDGTTERILIKKTIGTLDSLCWEKGFGWYTTATGAGIFTTLVVTGATTLTGNATVGGTLGVTGALTVSAAITTSAPVGGAGAWELGIANSVSPTSPNRTLTVEIGGTAYYIHAKTTND